LYPNRSISFHILAFFQVWKKSILFEELLCLLGGGEIKPRDVPLSSLGPIMADDFAQSVISDLETAEGATDRSVGPTDLNVSLTPRHGACALIAINERSRCKSRLSLALAPAARLELVRSMLSAVLRAAAGAQTLRHIMVVSPERDTVPAQIPVLADTGQSLNAALTEAHRAVLDFGCREVVILPADLPTISAADIDALVRAGRSGGFAIASDAADAGTNALCLAIAQPFRFQFGVDSKRLHLEAAVYLGLTPQVVNLPGLEFDIDSPADLTRLKEGQWLARQA
jgi:2-phospho-L-lactate guanylyltransferase